MYRLDNRIVPKRVKTIRLDNFKFPEKMYKIKTNSECAIQQNQA